MNNPVHNFFITGLPRSRTGWFSSYFTDGGVQCWHEATNRVRSRDQYWQRMGLPGFEAIGNSDCGLWMADWAAYIPGAPLVIIERDLEEVEASLVRQGIYGARSVLEEGWAELRLADGLRIRYEDIDVRLEEIHEYCVPTPFSEQRAKQFINANIQLSRIVPDVESIKVWS